MSRFVPFGLRIIDDIVHGLINIRNLPFFACGAGKQPPKVPDDFTPVLRFAVCSDVHLNGDPEQDNAKKFADLFKDCYAICEADDRYKALDAVLVAGDFTGGGREAEYQSFNRIVSEQQREGTQLLTVLGNHEFIAYRDKDATVGYQVYRKMISGEIDTHTVINGFHFIGVSYSDDGKTFKTKKAWLKEQLKKAAADTPDAPIFVFQHPHPFLTVYGSINWGNTTVASVLRKFPQVFDFSGHSHYISNDPRSVWQGAYTALGTAAINGLMGSLGYLNEFDYPEKAGEFYLVDVDFSGNVRVRLYDVVNHCFFKDIDYYFTDIGKKSSFVYSWHNRRRLDKAPSFPHNAQISVEKSDSGEYVLIFPDANDKYVVEGYQIDIRKKSGKHVTSKQIPSNDHLPVSDGLMRTPIGELESGQEYTVSIVAVNAYRKRSEKLKLTFRAQ
ncbi:MAG: metallophosphoesterase [Acutalibacteraceae bacterium]|jgi:hypothetical protein